MTQRCKVKTKSIAIQNRWEVKALFEMLFKRRLGLRCMKLEQSKRSPFLWSIIIGRWLKMMRGSKWRLQNKIYLKLINILRHFQIKLMLISFRLRIRKEKVRSKTIVKVKIWIKRPMFWFKPKSSLLPTKKAKQWNVNKDNSQ